MKPSGKTPEQLARILGYSGAALGGMRKKHGDKLVEVLEAEYVKRAEVPRLLHRNSSHGYTDQPALALPHEPEAVSIEVQRRITADAHAQEGMALTLAQAQREQEELLVRLAEVRETAARDKKDMSSDERVIEKRIRDIERRVRAA